MSKLIIPPDLTSSENIALALKISEMFVTIQPCQLLIIPPSALDQGGDDPEVTSLGVSQLVPAFPTPQAYTFRGLSSSTAL